MNTSPSINRPGRLKRIALSAGLLALFGGVTAMLILGINRHHSPVSYAAPYVGEQPAKAELPPAGGRAATAAPAAPGAKPEQGQPIPAVAGKTAIKDAAEATGKNSPVTTENTAVSAGPETPGPVAEAAARNGEEKTPLPATVTENAETTSGSREKPASPTAASPNGDQRELETAAPLPSPPELSWEPLIARLAADGFDADTLRPLFASLGCPPQREFMGQKAVELYGRYGKAALTLPEEERGKFAPPDYTRIAGGMSVAAGRRTIANNAKFFEGLYKRYGVPAPFIVAVMMVETGLGAEVGKQSALLALGSMASTDSLAHVLPVVSGIETNHDEMHALINARSDWAYNELKALLEYASASGRDAAAIPGSVYGAIGICQFMPSNIPLYGVSVSKQRPTPDVFVLSDAAASVARYLSAHGWRKAATPAGQIAVLRSYNHNDVYASTVYGVASALMSPTTHRAAESARKGGNAVTAARANARASIPSGSKKAQPMKPLSSYTDLLK